MTDPAIQQLQWPPEIVTAPDGGRTIATVPQDSVRDLQGSAALLCELRRGQLPWAPEVGITDPLATTDPEAAALLIEQDLRRLEPRPAGGITVQVVPTETGTRNLRLKVNT